MSTPGSEGLIPKPPEPSYGASNDQLHTRTEESGTKILSWAITPLILHLSIVVILIIALKSYIDGHDFNLYSRTALTHSTPLQSDITTAVSSCIAFQRFFAAMWSGSMYLRCIFILMEKGGISLQQINSLLFWKNHFYPRVKLSRRIALVVSIILLLSFPTQLSGPILTGSITWFSSSVLEGEDVAPVYNGYTGDLLNKTFNSQFPFNLSATSTTGTVNLYSVIPPIANGLAIIAWQGSRNDSRTMKRTIASDIPINSTLTNVTLPYFANIKLEWIKDPMRELDPVVLQSHIDISDWSPFIVDGIPYALPGTFAIIPDVWGVVNPPPSYNGIVNETRNIVGIFDNSVLSIFGKLPRNIGLYQPPQSVWSMIYGRLTYVAGVAECRNCRVSSWSTIQNDTEVTVSPHNLTAYALAMMPKVGATMAIKGTTLPNPLNNLDEYVTELFIRSYGVSWESITEATDRTVLQTNVQIAVSTSQAKVLWWRVNLWLALNLSLTVAGLLFLYIQYLCDERLIENPFMAALLLDTTDVQHKKNRALCGFSTLVDDDKGFGYLRLQRTEEGHKRVVLEG